MVGLGCGVLFLFANEGLFWSGFARVRRVHRLLVGASSGSMGCFKFLYFNCFWWFLLCQVRIVGGSGIRAFEWFWGLRAWGLGFRVRRFRF